MTDSSAVAPRQLVTDESAADRVMSTLLLQEERIHVAKRLRRTLVRMVRSTFERFVAVDEELSQQQVVIKRVPIGRHVDAVPPIREEGGVTILPIVEEELVLVRRLLLKEEVHVQLVRTTAQHVQTVTLRRQDVTVTRTDVTD